jgi:signal transduction histidine kinase
VKIALISQQPSTSAAFEAFSEAFDHELSCHSEIRNAEAALGKDCSDLTALEMSRDLLSLLPLVKAQKCRNPALALVFLGDGSDGQISQAMESGGEAYLTLPLRPELLALTLIPLLKKSELLSASQVAKSEASKIEVELRNSRLRQQEAIAEKDLTYRELLLAYSRLQELNWQKNSFLATATHELRTPVTVIRGYHRILLDERLGELLPQQREVLLESEQSCMRLIKIINSLLDLSRIETGKLDLIYQDYDLPANVRLIVDQLQEAFKRKRLTILLKMEEALPRLRCDRERINQVLTNLLENAIKYTPAGGKICVAARPHSDGEELPFSDRQPNQDGPLSESEQTLRRSSPSVVVQVTDTGIGISSENRQEIFEQFAQVSSQQMHCSGLHLGLAISKRIIEAHGGKIWVDSQINSGSRFAFLLPANPLEMPAAADAHSQHT